MFQFFCRAIYPVSKYFFLLQTKDLSKEHEPESKIILDVPTAVTILEDKIGILTHVKNVATAMRDDWNKRYAGQPQVQFLII